MERNGSRVGGKYNNRPKRKDQRWNSPFRQGGVRVGNRNTGQPQMAVKWPSTHPNKEMVRAHEGINVLLILFPKVIMTNYLKK